ncbi:hypothetical protein Tsubulata_051167 [Turnera subulata]|uniref:Acyl-[acyl-carrier-protein] desaturase n=1 Tax=Turnera subulata TaxID=218843 RepID=A0A9Q0GFY7_9ROSI|nr:hypothetical protein Tsubulata_051167 [Turnera subulata]
MALKLNHTSFLPSTHNHSCKSPSPRSPNRVMITMASTLGSTPTKETANMKKHYSSPRETHIQQTHSMPPQKMEIFKSIEGWAESNILVHLKPVEKCWQPQDFLPEPESDGFYEQVKELRERAKELSDDYFVVLVGDMITEEALPTYQTMLNTLDGVRDETGASLTPWAVWTRAWTAEENRHGDLLNKYLYLSGRVDMKQIEKTIQYLIGSGMDPKTENNPYLGFIYTSFQERATFISHGNTARLAKERGDIKLAQICGTIAADEKRHETAYTKIVEKLFEIDPDGTVLGLADMMRKKISMPAHLMYDGQDDNLFEHYSAVAQRIGVYTAKDYADILEFLVARWNVEKLTGLSGEGRKAQDFVCGLPPRIRRLEERAQGRAKQLSTVPFSWIFDREAANMKKHYSSPRETHIQRTHSMPPQKMEIFKSIEGWAESNILVHLKPVEKCWQPQDFLPEPELDGFFEQVKELKERAKELPDDYFVVLVGDMITEEALPTYQTMLNTADGVRDETGASLTPWAVWTRAWTAEENRHGDLLNKYLYLSGRVDMKQIEKTIQYLIGSGMDPKTENNPYLGFVYTSFQERATFISHGNTARLAKERGDIKLAQICGTIAADEKRHETAYTKIVEKLFEIDPDGTVLGLADMMRKKMAMPAHLMYDGQDDNLFELYSAVAQQIGVYTAKDYADILEFLVARWNVEKLTGLSGEGRKAQDFVCGLPPRIRRLEERAQGRAKQLSNVPFSWIFGREVKL